MELAPLLKNLLNYGALGVVVIAQMFVIAKLYRDREAERTRHSSEMETFRDRYVAKAETYMEKFGELARSTNNVIDSLQRAARERERARRITDADAR